MRLWTLHPKYLDPQGLVALWREGLLARAVLRDETRGYKNHPQLKRFRLHEAPRSAINTYLAAVHDESITRGYVFDRSKFDPGQTCPVIAATAGQLAYEWQHLLRKLQARNPLHFQRWCDVTSPDPHPLFHIAPGPVELWERQQVPG